MKEIAVWIGKFQFYPTVKSRIVIIEDALNLSEVDMSCSTPKVVEQWHRKWKSLFSSFFSSFFCVKNYFLNDLNKKHLSLSEENIENITISLHNILWCGQEFWVMIFNQKILFLPCTKIEYYSGFSIINDYFFIAGFILWTNHLRVNCIKKLQLQLVFTTI